MSRDQQPPASMRSRIIEAAITELAQNGSEFFRAAVICEKLFIARSLINHHFESQSHLIAEAAVTSYERYVELLAASAAAEKTPRGRLEAWIRAQGEWFRHNRGLVVLLQLPAPPYAQIFTERFTDRLTRGFRYNMTVLSWLVRDVQDNEVRPLVFDADSAPYDDLVADNLPLFLRAASVGLSSMGSGVWLAGQAMPTRLVHESFLQTTTIDHHIRWITRSVIAAKDPESSPPPLSATPAERGPDQS